MELVSFDDTVGEMENVIEMNILGRFSFPKNYVAMYNTIDEYEQSVGTDEVEVNIKYKTVNKKVKLVAVPQMYVRNISI